MLTRITFAIALMLTVIPDSNAQNLTRLIAYEEFMNDASGSPVHYKKYWHSFSKGRGTTLLQQSLVGWTYYGLFMDISAPDTTYVVNRQFGSGGYVDSFMAVHFYDSTNRTHSTWSYSWDVSNLSWKLLHGVKDSFEYNSSQLVATYNFLYDLNTGKYDSVRKHIFTYTGGKLLNEEIHELSSITNVWERRKEEYTWVGNDLTGLIHYSWLPATSSWYKNGSDRQTSYINGKPQVHIHEGWYLMNGTTPSISNYSRDSNVYVGNNLVQRYANWELQGPTYFNYRYNYKWNAKGSPLEILYELMDASGNWNNFGKTCFVYNADNNPVTIYDSTWKAGSWVPEYSQGNRQSVCQRNYYYGTLPSSIAPDNTTALQFKLYPSPAQHTITISTIFEKAADCTMAIVDMQGRLQRQWTEYITPGKYEVTIPVSMLPDGNYLLHLIAQGEMGVQQFTVLK